MVDENASPSASWREVYERMAVDDSHEEGEGGEKDAPPRCPGCGLALPEPNEHRCPVARANGDG